MKTIIYLLIAIFTFGIIARGIVETPQNRNQIIIQSNVKLNKSQLLESSKIIRKRMKQYGSGKFDIKVSPENQQILLTIDKSWNRKDLERLISRRGQFGIYETADSNALKSIIANHKKLLSLLHSSDGESTSSKIGCISKPKFNQVNDFLSKSKIEKPYKLFWEYGFDNSNICLYALKAKTNGSPFFRTNEISSFDLKQTDNGKREFIEFHFNASSVNDWASFTKKNLSKPIAITLDNEILYIPVIRSEIKGGNCQITGSFTQTELKFITAILRGGELASDFSIVK